MKRQLLLTLFFSLILKLAAAQDSTLITIDSDSVQVKEPKASKLVNLDILFRAALNANNFGQDDSKLNANLDDARIMVSGDYNDQFSYRVRFRLNRSFTPTSLDNASAALDFAFLKYKFGKENKWAVTLGKQSAMVGSFEFQNNPIYELRFSDYVGNILNLFVVGGMLSYDINQNHSINVQLYNTINHSFDRLLSDNGYTAGELEASKTPMGGYFTWMGSFLDKRIDTKWSYNISQFAKDRTNHAVSLANKFKTARQMIYLDLQYSYYAVDHIMLGSSVINDFYGRTGAERTLSKDITYKSAILRYDQFITDKWEIALKGAFETVGSKAAADGGLGADFRKNYTYFAALQNKPLKNRDLRFYLGYMGNTVTYNKNVELDSKQFNRIALGAYFTIPVL
ncbi:porin [Sphingobacterium endophyticum]|uniref:porin n=1 Tax=Sphingobacterium endophyticum TaxID=2546448 RepID=UPI0012E17581|nr:porin [Sphingobacterium endophyticum]